MAPVIEADARRWEVYLPAGVEWVHLWSGARFGSDSRVSVDAELGEPPVFYRGDSGFVELFAQMARRFPAGG